MLIEHKHTVRRKVIISGEGIARQEIVHRLVELDAHWRVLVVQQEKDALRSRPFSLMLTWTVSGTLSNG